MKSITVTTHRTINYGAVLQAYALQKTQEKIGIENRVLELPKKEKLMHWPALYPFRRLLIETAYNANHLIHYKKSKTLLSRFNSFVDNNIKRTQKAMTLEELDKNFEQADFYICGSDQVFDINSNLNKTRMLQFGGDRIKRYSFAASLGNYEWNDEEKKEFAKSLSSFRMISVRENYAKDYIESFTDKKCEVHLDPTFLLSANEWSEVAGEQIEKEKYILCYPLIGNANLQNAIDELKKKTGYKVISVQTVAIKRVKADKYIFDAGPKEFVNLIKNAEYVITTSFHGTAFSIIFKKDFFTLTKDYKSQRMTELLERFGLSDRLYDKGKRISLEPVDYSKYDDVITSEKERSIDYLKRVVKEAKIAQ